MKIIKCAVRCEYWNSSKSFDVEVDDDAAADEIEAAIRDAAIEAAGFEYWREDDEPKEQ